MNKNSIFGLKKTQYADVLVLIVIGFVFSVLPMLSANTAAAQEMFDDGSGWAIPVQDYFDWTVPTLTIESGVGGTTGGSEGGVGGTTGGSEGGVGGTTGVGIAVAPAYDSTVYEYYYYPSYSNGYSYSYGYSYPSYTYSTPTYTYTSPTYTYAPYTYEPNPTCSLTASDTSIDEGDRIALRWSTDNATAVSINRGIGSVSRNSSEFVTPHQTVTYVLTATGPGGTTQCYETVYVDEDVFNNDNVRCDAFTVTDSSVERGDRVTLRWRTTDADTVYINHGVGYVSDDGSETVIIDEDTTFTLTAENNSDTDTCRVRVNVGGSTNSNAVPQCHLTISDTDIRSGQPVTLTWNNLRTDRAVLRDNHGREIADSDTDRNINEDRDSLVLRPTQSTQFTLTVYNDTVRRTCTVGTTVDGISLVGARVQDTISLTQVPYTGFEAGPVLTYIFYGAIVLWGIVLAYILVLRKKPETVAVTTSVESPESITHTVHPHEVEVVNAPYNHFNFIPDNLPMEEVAEDTVLEQVEDSIHALEQHAHTQYALVSSDALRFIEGQGGSIEEQIATLDKVIALAKARFPKEGDWIVINKERVLMLLA